MHQAGTAFLYLLLTQHRLSLDPLTHLEVRTQVRNLDILLYAETASSSFALVIEDKIHATNANPLATYLATAKELYPNAKHVLGTYLRTGDQSNYHHIQSEGFQIITRQTLLDFLNANTTPNPTNTIFQDFKRHLLHYQQSIDNYKTAPIPDWDSNAWIGFFNQALIPNPQLHFNNYHYVTNHSGGFQASWTAPDYRPIFADYPIYLQIEGSMTAQDPSRIAIKLETVSKQIAQTKDIDRYQLVRQLADKITRLKPTHLYQLTRPRRLSAGQYMTAAELPLVGEDIPRTPEQLIGLLQQLQDFIPQLEG